MHRLSLFICIVSVIGGLGVSGYGVWLFRSGDAAAALQIAEDFRSAGTLDAIVAIVLGILVSVSGVLFSKWLRDRSW